MFEIVEASKLEAQNGTAQKGELKRQRRGQAQAVLAERGTSMTPTD
jgi:hypothetical protein